MLGEELCRRLLADRSDLAGQIDGVVIGDPRAVTVRGQRNVAGALRRYLIKRGDRIGKTELRIAIIA